MYQEPASYQLLTIFAEKTRQPQFDLHHSIVLRLKHYETGEPVVNKSIKYPSIKYVQWAFIIRKDIYETGDPIVLEVLFSETMPGVLEKAKLFRLEAFVPRSGGEMELVVMEPIIALEMDE